MRDVLDLLTGECPALGLAGAEHAPVRARGVDATVVYRPTPGERRPLDVLAAVVTNDDWDRGLSRAGRFGAYCPRILSLTAEPADVPWVAVEATFYGIGLVVAGRLLVAPEPFRERTYSAAGDRFAEDIHHQITNHKEGVPAWRT